MKVLVVGEPSGRRVPRVANALSRLGFAAPEVLSWVDVPARLDVVRQAIRSGALLRLEAPEGASTDAAFVRLGMEQAACEGAETLESREIDALACDKGRLLPTRAWFFGFQSLLASLELALGEARAQGETAAVSHAPHEVALAFDKCATQPALRSGGVPVPEPMGSPGSFAEVLHLMQTTGIHRVFVKLAHGSAAAGVVALALGPRGALKAVTPVEMVTRNGRVRLYNSRRLSVYSNPRDVSALVDALARNRIHAERWMPKLSLGNGFADLRVLVIAGRPQHVVVRVARGPFTNLHLGGGRSTSWRCTPEEVIPRIGIEAYRGAIEAARRAAGLLPGTLCVGVDVLLGAGGRGHAVNELNAFGDQLPGVLHEGLDAQEASLRAHRHRLESERRTAA